MSFRLSFLAFLPVSLLVCYGCGNRADKQAAAGAAPPAQPYPVFTATTHNAVLRSEYPAMLQGQQNIEIRPKIDGFIENIFIDEGSTVKRGQLLFKISAPQYEQE